MTVVIESLVLTDKESAELTELMRGASQALAVKVIGNDKWKRLSKRKPMKFTEANEAIETLFASVSGNKAAILDGLDIELKDLTDWLTGVLEEAFGNGDEDVWITEEEDAFIREVSRCFIDIFVQGIGVGQVMAGKMPEVTSGEAA